ncbi:MAG TPA: ABC transporter ATP-binding protein [Anaeromyxobacteraceae bacterium]|nr:ABC transporter ATP-binding protein [Anaeromyxobacteraceae bacterium]
MAPVETRGLTKRHRPDRPAALEEVTLAVEDGEFLVFLGPSGSGKTTLLRLIAGLEQPTSGDVLIGDVVVTRLTPAERNVAMVFQSYALYPHLSVRRNIEFPLKVRGTSRPVREEKVQRAASILGIGHLLDQRPRNLSGGERQRVALARAMVREPSVFLLDEPLSNLDAKLRSAAREELAALHRRLGTTTIYVTHDQVEAMALGDRIVVLDGGRIRQVGTPREVYEEPANTFVAQFIGSPPMNVVPGGDVLVGFRPEHVRPESLVREPRLLLPTRIDATDYLGFEVVVLGRLVGGPSAGARITARLPAALAREFAPGEEAGLAVPRSRLCFFDARTQLRRTATELTWV